MDINTLKRHFERLRGNRLTWDTTWRELAEFEFPRRLLHLDNRLAGEQMSEELLDSTAYFSATVLASAMHSGLTNPNQRWMSIQTTDPELNEDDDVRLKLEADTQKMLMAFTISNLTPELGELYMDLAIFGVGALFLGEVPEGSPPVLNGFRGFQFQSYPVGSFWIEEDGFGVVDTIFVNVPEMTVAAAAARWGAENLSEQSRELLRKNPERTLRIIHAVFPTEKFAGATTKAPFISVWFELEKAHQIHEGGFLEFPYFVPRWTKASGEVYGRGPGLIALPEVKRLNKLIELELKALALMVLPPQKATMNSVIGALDFTPGGLTFLRQLDDLQPIIGGQRIDVAKIDQQEWRASIRNIFSVDQLLQLLGRDTPAMTATEVQVKVQLLHQILGPALHRMTSELLRPMVNRGYRLMERAGAFGDQIPELEDNRSIRIEFEGPLVRGQRGHELLAIERVLLMAQGFAGLNFPEVFDNLNPDEALRITSEISGAPETIIRTQEEVVAIRKKRQDEQQRQAELAQLQQGSEVARNIAPLAKAVSEGQEARRE